MPPQRRPRKRNCTDWKRKHVTNMHELRAIKGFLAKAVLRDRDGKRMGVTRLRRKLKIAAVDVDKRRKVQYREDPCNRRVQRRRSTRILAARR